MNRFTRFKILRALWARARALLAWLHGPQHQHLRLRMQRWQQVQVAERHLLDGMVRSTEDPDARVAHRTSPTNIGLYVLSCLAAHDFGYLSLSALLGRLEQSAAIVERLR